MMGIGKEIQKCYLIYGEEEWIKNKIVRDVKKQVLDEATELMNYSIFEGKEVIVSTIIDTCETMPFFSDRKLVIVKNSGLFKSGKKEESEKLADWISVIPEYVVLLFLETEVDKRGRLYKQIKGCCTVIEVGYPGNEEMIRILSEKYQNINRDVLTYFLQNMPQNITYTLNEFEKLLDYTRGREITQKDIDAVCIFSLEQRVFTLVKEVTNKNTIEALRIYKALIESKESPIGVLVLIARQYRMMLQVKYLIKANTPQKQIASEVGVPFFAVKEIVKQTELFSFKQLEEAIKFCLESDILIKTGQMEAVQCIEILLIKCIYL